MAPTDYLILIPIVFSVGVFVGCIGIGGVVLVPVLAFALDVELRIAIASCMMSYLFSGLIGAFSYARQGSLRWSTGGWLAAGAMPGAFIGAALVPLVPRFVLETAIAVLVCFASLQALRHRPVPAGPGSLDTPSGAMLLSVGLVTGIGSAMTGTGGPLILVPLLLWLGLPVLATVGLSQIIQVPIALLATIANFRYGEVDIVLALCLAVLLMAGVVLGARLAHLIPARTLSRLLGSALLLLGGVLTARLALQYAG